jgi:uncharacterized repeat protein (TIGR03803 family)
MKSLLTACVILISLGGCARQSAGDAALTPALPSVISNSAVKTVYAFPHRSFPRAGVVDVNGTLYGTTTVGGPSGLGIVYSLTPDGSEKMLHNFKGGSDGAQPEGGLIDVDGVLYGTTYEGGGSACRLGCGTVFSITTGGTEKVLHSFTNGADGAFPAAPLINAGGTLYGTTTEGGGRACYVEGKAVGCGTVFSITTSGTEKVVYPFSSESGGEFPQGALTWLGGALYGTTSEGGLDARGTVFRVTTAGKESTIHNFGAGTDGANPHSQLLDVHGTLYGTTLHGGNGAGDCRYACGTVFSITPRGAETTLHSFNPSPDGANPSGGLIAIGGVLYGTTEDGGKNDAGTVFSLTPAGKENVLFSFLATPDGASPQSALIDVKGTLFGTTYSGGVTARCCGTVFSLTP